MASQPASLVGYPIAWAANIPAIAAGATPIAFGDFRQAYTIVDRLGISTLRDPFTAKPFVLFYTRRRVGGDVVNFEAYKLLLIGV
jgi:HK97 family phage major capsid protein